MLWAAIPLLREAEVTWSTAEILFFSPITSGSFLWQSFILFRELFLRLQSEGHDTVSSSAFHPTGAHHSTPQLCFQYLLSLILVFFLDSEKKEHASLVLSLTHFQGYRFSSIRFYYQSDPICLYLLEIPRYSGLLLAPFPGFQCYHGFILIFISLLLFQWHYGK